MRFSLNEEDAETVIYQRLPISVHKQLVEFMNTHRYRSRNEAINDLLSIGMIVCSNIHKIKDPELVEEIKQQLKEGGLVDYVSKLNPKEFEIIWSIIRTEAKIRKVEFLEEKLI